MAETIYGTFVYHGKNYPFFLDGRRVFIVGKAWEYQENFDSHHTEEVIYGTTSGNRSVVFLRCKFYKSVFGQKVWFSPIGYAISQNNIGEPYDFSFDRILFYSEALNSFFPPQKAIGHIDFSLDNWDGGIGLQLKPFRDTDISFDYENCTCRVNIARNINLKDGTRSIGDINTTFAFEFQASQCIEELPKYWLALFDFLSFVNNASDIVFEKIKFDKRRTDGKFESYADVIIFSNTEYTPRPNGIALTLYDLPQDKLGSVFSKIVNLRGHDERLQYYFSKNYEDNFRVDPLKWLTAAINFDGLSSKQYSGFKQNTNEMFRMAKNAALNALDTVNLAAMEPKAQKYYRDCRDEIDRYEGRLEEMMNYLVKKYKDVLVDLLKQNQNECGIEINAYGEKYRIYRNKLAHGDIPPIGPEEFAVYRVLQALVYFMLLEGTGLGDDDLRIIAKKLFL